MEYKYSISIKLFLNHSALHVHMLSTVTTVLQKDGMIHDAPDSPISVIIATCYYIKCLSFSTCLPPKPNSLFMLTKKPFDKF